MTHEVAHNCAVLYIEI